MKLSLAEIKDKTPGLKIINNGFFTSLGLTITDFGNEYGLSYLSSKKFLNEFKKNKNISCLICNNQILNEIRENDIGICIAEDPKAAFFNIHNYLVKETSFFGLNMENVIHKTAIIHPSSHIAKYNVYIGKNTIIEPNVVIFSNVKIHDNVILKAGSVIGGDGFQAFKDKDVNKKVYSGGKVIIGENVEIGNNTCIDKGVFNGATVINKNTKIDNLVHVGHDVVIGENCLITANALLGGRTVIGDDVWIGVSSVVSNGLRIGNKAKISLGAVVTKNVKEEQIVSGNFAIDHKRFIEFMRTIR